jgi:hypothetical protein
MATERKWISALARGRQDVLPLIKRAAVHTRAGGFVFQFELAIP